MSKPLAAYNSSGEESHAKSLQAHNRKATNDASFGKDVKSNPNNPGAVPGGTPTGEFSGDMMDFTFDNMGSFLEALNKMAESMDGLETSLMDAPLTEEPAPTIGVGGDNTQELLETLNQIYTPILIMQSFEPDVAGQIQEAFSEANLLTERNIIKFDESARMAQLQSVCALVLARQRQMPQYKAFESASSMARKLKLEIQKSLFAEAKALATQYLVKVSTTTTSAAARDSAQRLMPETQH